MIRSDGNEQTRSKAPPTHAPDGMRPAPPAKAPPIRAPVAPWTSTTVPQIAATVPDPPPLLRVPPALGDITEKLSELTTAVTSLSEDKHDVLQHIDALETSIAIGLAAGTAEVVKLKRALRAKNIISQGSDDIGLKDEGHVDEASPLSQGRIPVMGVPRGQVDGGPDSSSNTGESDWDRLSTKCAPGMESND